MHENTNLAEYKIYRSKEFVNREKEIQEVMKFLEDKQRGVMIIEGDRGSGKTALLLELFRQLNQLPQYRPFFIGLFPYDAPEFKDAANIWLNQQSSFIPSNTADLLEKLAKYFQVTPLETNEQELQKEYLARELSRSSVPGTPVLLVDSIYECEEASRVELETNILTPLLVREKAFLVLSGRGKRPIWGRPELQNAQIMSLLPMSKQDAIEQLKRMESRRSEEEYEQIAELSGGFPLTVRVIGNQAKVDLSKALSEAIDVLLRESLSEKAIKQAVAILLNKEQHCHDHYEIIRRLVERLSLLNISFRIVEVADYLFPDDPERQVKTDALIKLLLRSYLLRYEGKGYQLNRSIVHPIRKWLEMPKQENKREKYVSDLREVSKKLQDAYPNAKQWYQQMVPENYLEESKLGR